MTALLKTPPHGERSSPLSVPLEELHRTLMFFGGGACAERSEIASSTRLWIGFPGIQTVAGAELANHRTLLESSLAQLASWAVVGFRRARSALHGSDPSGGAAMWTPVALAGRAGAESRQGLLDEGSS